MAKGLTHTQFYQVVECVKINREGIAQKSSWREASDFASKKLRELGYDFGTSEHSIKEACEAAGIQLSGRRRMTTPTDREQMRNSIEILARAVGLLYENLGQQPSPGLQRLLDIARRNRGATADATTNGHATT